MRRLSAAPPLSDRFQGWVGLADRRSFPIFFLRSPGPAAAASVRPGRDTCSMHGRLKAHLGQFANITLFICACACSSPLLFAQQSQDAPPAQRSQSQPPAQQSPAAQFPAGPGRDTFLRVCSTCHSPNNVLAAGQSREGWEDTVTKMVAYGAQGSDEDFTDILDYLVKNFPEPVKVNVNKATPQQLEAQLTLTPKDAEAVVAYREKNGDFKSLGDLEKVPDIDTAKLNSRKAQIVFQ